jgi:tRNA(Ile)-lysidine synthase
VSTAEAAGLARPLTAAEARALFADLAPAPALVLAVSGGPDSTALLWLAARWRAKRKRGPKLLAVTIDHGLRPESAGEARDVARLARRLGVAHRTIRWRGKKPKTRLQQEARAARYRLLAQAARKIGATHVLTAHTLDDQAETVLMRLLRGSGLAGLAGMGRTSPLPECQLSPSPNQTRVYPEFGTIEWHKSDISDLCWGEGWGAGGPSLVASHRRNPLTRRAVHVDLSPQARGEQDLILLRPFLDVPKARLVATLRAAAIAFAEDRSNIDPRFTRVRLRALLPTLAKEGLSAERLALLARRLRRADAALAAAVDRAAAELLRRRGPDTAAVELDARGFAALPAEIALRLLGRAVSATGNEGPVELSKLEALYRALAGKSRSGGRFRRTLAGAMVTLTPDRLIVERAPARRAARGALTTPRRGRHGAGKLR